MANSKPVAFPNTSIEEIEYWLRLATFLHEPLKNAFLDVLHNTANDPTYAGLPADPFKLYQELSKHGNLIIQLVKKRILQKDQVDLLLPPNDNKTYSKTFDVTLIAILIRNFTTLKPPLNGWNDKYPPAHDRSKGAGVIRGREWRNYVHHTDPKDIDQSEFNQKWVEGTQIITDLGYKYNANQLKKISLDPRLELVQNSLSTFKDYLKAKHDLLEAKHDSVEAKHDLLDAKHDSVEAKHDLLQAEHDSMKVKHKTLEAKQDSNIELISSLTQHVNKISKVQYLHVERENSSSCCLKNVLEYISKEIKEEEAEELLSRLNVQADGDLVDKLKSVPWKFIKTELEMLQRTDIIEYITKETLITRENEHLEMDLEKSRCLLRNSAITAAINLKSCVIGLQNASDKLREHYKTELSEYPIEKPLSAKEIHNALREDIYIDLVVLPSSRVDEEYNNSDRDSLMKQNFLNRSSTENAVDEIIEPQDGLIFIRGVAGIGKSTLIDMFTLKWAKKELSNPSMFDFVFKFTCREINQILEEFETLDQLFKLQYQNIFSSLTLEDLSEVSDRVLIIVDGVDELKDIYKMDRINTSAASQTRFLQVIFDLINPKSVKSPKNHKTIVCGRPRACEFVKNQFSTFKMKTIEVCGFNDSNVQKYILNFFNEDQIKAKTVQVVIASSYNLKIMSTVPVFLWVICNVYGEDLIERPINTNTELYLYTCLVFLRNHFQGPYCKYKNLLDIINDEVMVDVVYSLMVLSAKTYMQNQVLFTDEDIKKLNCPVHLEQTGFIIKYSRSNIKKPSYQFRHLVLQEFLCGMYLCVTKGISPFISNRELSSCLPTVFGIHRIVQEKENDIFLQFYDALVASNKKHAKFFAKVFAPFKTALYKVFIKMNIPRILKLPNTLTNGITLFVTDEPHCREFLDLFKEINCDIDAPWVDNAVIKIRLYKDLQNVLNLLERLNIATVSELLIERRSFFGGNVDENILQFFAMKAESSMETTIRFDYKEHQDDIINCKGENLWLFLREPLPSCITFPEIIKAKTNNFHVYIDDDVLNHIPVQLFLQEISKYAIENCKMISFSIDAYKISLTMTLYFFKAIFKDVNIDIESKYVQIFN